MRNAPHPRLPLPGPALQEPGRAELPLSQDARQRVPTGFLVPRRITSNVEPAQEPRSSRPEETPTPTIQSVPQGGSNRQSAIPCFLLLACLLALGTGCRLLSTPAKVVTAVTPSDDAKKIDPLVVQLELQRFCDNYLRQGSLALDDYAQRVGTDAARFNALQLKFASGFSVISIASGPSPAVNLIDMVTIAVLTRRTVEDYWSKRSDGAAFERWLAVSRTLETNIWQLAESTFKPEQVQELRAGINQWCEQNPDVRTAFLARPQELAGIIRKSSVSKEKQSVFNLDPMAGLDPAVREIAATRLFAERALFTFQRMPYLVRLQTELLVDGVAQQPDLQVTLTNLTRVSESADRISHAVESLSQTAAELPDRISAERAAILQELEQQEGKLRDLAAEVGHTLSEAQKMSDSLTITLTRFDALMKRFGVGEPPTGPPDTNSPPFEILDYAETANRIGAMARDLNALIASVDSAAPQVARLGEQAGADARQVVDQAFRQGLILIVVLLAGSVGAALLYRILARRLAPDRRPPSSPGPPR